MPKKNAHYKISMRLQTPRYEHGAMLRGSISLLLFSFVSIKTVKTSIVALEIACNLLKARNVLRIFCCNSVLITLMVSQPERCSDCYKYPSAVENVSRTVKKKQKTRLAVANEFWFHKREHMN